jgi:hypothetical protein
MIIASIILLLSGGLFAAQRAEGLLGRPQFLDHHFIFTVSWVSYVVAVVIVYVAHVYRNYLEGGAASVFDQDTQRFVKAFLSQRIDK